MLVKQVVGPSGELAMDELSGIAVAQGVELCAAVGDGMCTAITVGPATAEAVLREAIAWGGTCSVMTDGLLLSDPAFDGSDSLAVAHAIAAAITQEGPFDLVLLGAESSDTSTGQLGPQVAELLDLPFVACARYLSMQGSWIHVRGRHEDGWLQAVVQLPAVVSCAAGLTDPCDPEPAAQALVPHDLIRRVAATDLGTGPWGLEASAATVRSLQDAVQLMHIDEGFELPSAEAVPPPTEVWEWLAASNPVPPSRGGTESAIAVIAEPGRDPDARKLLGTAAELADATGGHVVALVTEAPNASLLGWWGADEIVLFAGAAVEEDLARAVADWTYDNAPWAVIAPASVWGREVAGRAAARLGAGLAGDAWAVWVDDGRLVASRSAGDSVALIGISTPTQFVTLHAENQHLHGPRESPSPRVRKFTVHPRGRVRVASRTRKEAD